MKKLLVLLADHARRVVKLMESIAKVGIGIAAHGDPPARSLLRRAGIRPPYRGKPAYFGHGGRGSVRAVVSFARGLMVLTFAFAPMASADPRYVVKDNPGAAEPYDSWDNAAGDIQTAVSYAYAGETVWVSNGVYDTGGVLVGTQTNRVAITNEITVRSANNDPANTIIKGAWDPATNGPSAVRCVCMINGSSLIGFTLTNGATLTTTDGGGVYCWGTNSIISNCVITGNSAKYGGGAYQGKLYNCTLTGNTAPISGSRGGGTRASELYDCTLTGNSASDYGGGAWNSTMYNCTLTSNSANSGGGVFQGTLYNCTLTTNSARFGGGAYQATLYNCALTNNSAWGYGGGAYMSTLSNCTIVGSSGPTHGGGAYISTLYNCTLTGNSASQYGGGAYNGTLYNCTLTGNSAAWGGAVNHQVTLYNCAIVGNWATYGGGASGGTTYLYMYNCTIIGNSASGSGGGVYEGTMYNCISWGNNKVDYDGNWYYSCAAGITGDGTITNDPLFIADGSGYGASHVAGNYRLSNGSPCINTGTNFSWMTDPADVGSKDLDGSPRIDSPFSSQVDMGCYEHMPRGTIVRIH